MLKINKEEFKANIVNNLRFAGTTLENATKREIFDAVSKSAMNIITKDWLITKSIYEKEEVKQAYYLSAEFLMGRAFSNNLVNLTIYSQVKEVLDELKIDVNIIEDQEEDAGLGNGGLGRLAACFLDSLATLGLPGHGYGIRYKYGMFKQKIVNGFQVEYPDKWLDYKDPWEIERREEAVTIKFGGKIIVEKDETGREHFKRVDAELISAIPFDMPIVGYGNGIVNTLRLWQSESPNGFNLQVFNDQHYNTAVKDIIRAEDISRVLYPNDSGPSGKELRLRQQYFFVSASLQDLIKKFKIKHGTNFNLFPEKVSIQLNDTHPVVAIPELMRILIDWEKLEWDEAWGIVVKTCNYTNHTILSEALEKWPINIFQGLLPRVYQIIEEINRRFMIELRLAFPGDWSKHNKMSIISNNTIKMAWLAIHGSSKVNGVAALHTEILKNQELKDWYEMYPHKFLNKTNGITQRRWLLKANPALSNIITELIGDKWITDLSELKKLENYADNIEVLDKFIISKHEDKVKLASYIKEHNQIEIDPNSIYDVQIKRLHEYKRQLLNVLHIIDLYFKVKNNPNLDIVPRTFIFGAKSASGYRRAKNIIKLVNAVGEIVNNDVSINGKIKVVFLENYRVSLAEKIFPAANVSEQISTAGKEASGTGNMKFMINGAPTIGTLDGANVEIIEEAGEENNFIFGLTSKEVQELNDKSSYNPLELTKKIEGLERVMTSLIDGTFSSDSSMFQELYNSLLYGIDGNRPDEYYLLKDFESYREAQKRVDLAYKDKYGWAKKAWLNIANGGKFSSDRTILEYANEIWNIKQIKVK
ncbi:MAG: glycogen/starch/alpha-glucan phosphorylase [Fusobacteriaceae bacterium]|nr:glycogen/starch/alpha-glucan phosphorylase [Fusobacteriaceae bacterium]MBP6467771.1 glycogen/starch/alpha-glucan phosphorylase [Fusobacteriaceae bacterium]MBP9596426.1 glycogen/starch/alpha-glucan phosphorylase [Fusobacteriaceae bacterium]